MDRKDFFKNVCKYSACGCAGMMLFSPDILFANEETLDEKKEDWRVGFMQNRIAGFIEDMYDKLEEDTLISLLENLGRYCAKENIDNYVKFKDDINGYLKSIDKWVEKAEHNEEKGTILLIGKKNSSCFCPFVDISKMPKEFCNCTKGWNKETYETIIGKQVEVKINTTVLWGGDRCSFTITYK